MTYFTKEVWKRARKESKNYDIIRIGEWRYSKRYQRAWSISYIVIKNHGNSRYLVVLRGDGKHTCTCPDSLYRVRLCKHIAMCVQTHMAKERGG